MKQRVALQLISLAAVLLPGAGLSWAAIQGRVTVCWLGAGGWQLREKAGEVYLALCPWDKSYTLPSEKRYRWHVSAPTIRAESGKSLASDPSGRTPLVRLVSGKGANARWVFEVVCCLQPEQGEGKKVLKEGLSGFTFRVRAAEGPFKGWYLAAEELAAGQKGRKGQVVDQKEHKGQQPGLKRLRLVREVKGATVFTYIDVNYVVYHK
jgi:hypothetical protein